MRRTLINFSLSASMIIALSSCSSDDGFSDGTFVDSTPYSEVVTLDDGAIPPWLKNYDDGRQVNADNRTPTYNGSDTAKVESSDETGFFGQKQSLASNEETIVLEAPGDKNPFETKFGDTTPGQRIVTPKPKKPKTRTRTIIKRPSIIVYKVKKGDNLSVIAQRSGTTVAAIRRASGIKGSLIYAGQTIKVPYTPKGYKAPKSSSSPYRGKTITYTVRSGDSISVIAARYGTSTSAVLRANNMNSSAAKSIQVGQKIKVPTSKRSSNTSSNRTSSAGKNYTIKSGDTLSEIASSNGVSTSALMKANRMNNNDARRLRPGQKIIIP